VKAEVLDSTVSEGEARVLVRVLTLLALLGYSLYVLYSTLLALSTVSEGQGRRAGYP